MNKEPPATAKPSKMKPSKQRIQKKTSTTFRRRKKAKVISAATDDNSRKKIDPFLNKEVCFCLEDENLNKLILDALGIDAFAEQQVDRINGKRYILGVISRKIDAGNCYEVELQHTSLKPIMFDTSYLMHAIVQHNLLGHKKKSGKRWMLISSAEQYVARRSTIH